MSCQCTLHNPQKRKKVRRSVQLCGVNQLHVDKTGLQKLREVCNYAKSTVTENILSELNLLYSTSRSLVKYSILLKILFDIFSTISSWQPNQLANSITIRFAQTCNLIDKLEEYTSFKATLFQNHMVKKKLG